MRPSTQPRRGPPNPQRQATRLAQRVWAAVLAIHDDRLSSVSSRLTTFACFGDDLRDTQRRLDRCRSRGWEIAARALQDRLHNLLLDLSRENEGLRALLADQRGRPMPTMGDLLAELKQIEDEFEAHDYDPAAQTLWVKTEPITLDEVYLGPFKIELRLRDLSGLRHSQPFRVIALDPHPAGSNEVVTHPHVSDQRLCEGEATVPIRSALEQGRLCEFFMLVRSVLTTYNPNSPYVALDCWDGVSCYDCGSNVGEDGTNSCNGCENTFCDDCSSYCRRCESTFCQGCLTECPSCNEKTCKDCLKECDECGEKCCTGCLVDDLCPDCLKKKKETAPDGQTQPQTASAAPPESRKALEPQQTTISPKTPNLSPSSSASKQNPLPPKALPAIPRPRRRAHLRGRLMFSPLAWLKLQFFLHAGDVEVGGFGVSAPTPGVPAPGVPGAHGASGRDQLLYVNDFVTVSQRNTVASVAFDDQAVADYFENCVDKGIHPSRAARIWCHTHPGESPEPSGTDEETFAKAFGQCDWSVMFIMGRTGQTYARLSFSAGPGAAMLLPVAVDWAAWPALASDPRTLDAVFQGWVNEYLANIHPEVWDLASMAQPGEPGASQGGPFSLDDLEPINPWDRELVAADLDEPAARGEEVWA